MLPRVKLPIREISSDITFIIREICLIKVLSSILLQFAELTKFSRSNTPGFANFVSTFHIYLLPEYGLMDFGGKAINILFNESFHLILVFNLNFFFLPSRLIMKYFFYGFNYLLKRFQGAPSAKIHKIKIEVFFFF